MAVESAPRRSEDAGHPPAGSWLARAMQEEDANGRADLLRGEDAVALASCQESARLFIFCGEPAMAFTRGGSLCIERDGEMLHRIPWSHLDAVLLFGRHHITTPALHEAMKNHVPVHMATASGRYLGVAASGRAGMDASRLWLAQQSRFGNEAWAMAAARSIIDARIRHMAENLRRRKGVSGSEWKRALDQALRHAARAETRDELNGVEGHATKAYFAAMKPLIPDGFGFQGRKRRPPTDPFNALLSLGYTLLYAYVDSLLRADGLLPVSGFYHRSHGSHSALASDLMEPFRHLVEREALNMLTGKRLMQDDFILDGQACHLSAPARRLFIGSLIEAMLKPLKARGGAEPLSSLEHIHRQNLSLKFALAGKVSAFHAWRMR